MATRQEIVDFFFETFPGRFQGDASYWYEPRGAEDADFIDAFNDVFNKLGDEDRKLAADFLFENEERFEGDVTYWYIDRGAENQDFVSAFSDVFSNPSETDQGGGVETGPDGPDETVAEGGVGGQTDETVSILTSRDMQWHFDPATGKWLVSYKMPNTDRRLVFEASGSQLDAIFGEGQRPLEYESVSFAELTQREGITFAGDIAEVEGTGSFEAEIESVIARSLDEGTLPEWAKADPEVTDLLYISVAEGKGQDWLIEQLAKLPSFQQRFPGISAFQNTGLNISESVSAFLELEEGVKELVMRDGGDPNSITPATIGDLVAKGHSLSDVQFVFGAFDRMEKNAGALSAFNEILAARGLNPLDEDGQFDFMAGNAPAELYDIWEESSLHQAALDAGLSIGVQGAIDLAARTEGLTSYDAALEGLNQAAKNLLQFRSELALDQYDLNEQDLIDLSLGLAPSSGTPQADIARNIDRAVRSATAAVSAKRSNPFVRFTNEGVPQQASNTRQRQESA
jgi:hypothetical protein